MKIGLIISYPWTYLTITYRVVVLRLTAWILHNQPNQAKHRMKEREGERDREREERAGDVRYYQHIAGR